jgi:S-adenosylmethionine synthetase
MITNFVNKLIFLFALIPLLIVNGCKKLDIEKELRIDIGTQFQNDFVKIKLDNNIIFSDSVSTNQILGVSRILIIDYPIGKYDISVNVNGIEKKDKIRHKNDMFIHISFDKLTSTINISYPTEKYVYD